MSLRTIALAGVLVLTGCASHPERPDTATTAAKPAPTAAAAHLFDGCTAKDVDSRGYLLQCGTLLASTRRAMGVSPDAMVEAHLGGMKQAIKADFRVSDDVITLAGAKHPAKLVAIYRKAGDASPAWTGYVVGLGDAEHGSRVVSCGAATAPDAARCTDILEWVATHDKVPPGIPAESEPPDGEWPPKGSPAMPASCQAVPASKDSIRYHCPDAEIVLARVGNAPGGQGFYVQGLHAASEQALESLKAKIDPGTTLTYVDCQLGGKPAACSRLRASGKGGTVELVMAVGELYGASAVVQCTHLVSGKGLPAPCSTLIDIGAKPPTDP